MKTVLLVLVVMTITLSGCTQTPLTGQVVLEPQEEPEIKQLPVIEIIEEEITEYEPIKSIEPVEIPELKPIELVYVSKDKCLHTWNLSVPEREYKECYNENYILKVKAITTIEFCDEIEDPSFLSKCYRHLAWKQRDPSICENGKYLFIEVRGVVKNYEVSVSDNCYYEYELFHGPTMDDEERDQLCENIQEKQTKTLCIKNIIRGKKNE